MQFCPFPCTILYKSYLFLIVMIWHRQAIFESKGDKLSSSAECRIRTQGLRHQIASRLNAPWEIDWAIEDQAKKTWTPQSVLMIIEHSAHSTPLPVGFRTRLWRYTCLLLLIPMLWHRQAIFESKETSYWMHKCLTKVAKFGPFPYTILYKSCLIYPWWQATSFERPSSWVAFIRVLLYIT